jgi:acetate kinase
MSEPGVVLVLNAGSSSLKFCVYEIADRDTWQTLARGQIEGIGTAPRFSTRDEAGQPLDDRPADGVADQSSALESLASWLRERFQDVRLLGVGHRVVHGGARYSGPVMVTPRVMQELRTLVPLAPLHQPHNLAAIDAVSDRLPGVPQVACFDTSFHRGHRAVVDILPLPAEIRRLGVQRYGFHGLSYEYIASALPEVAPEIADRRVIVAHLGSGASLCAMKNGRSIDTSLGFSALDGLCMATRPGALDPGVVLYLFQGLRLSAKAVESMLYMRSGLLGLSGISGDMRVLLASRDSAAQLAVDYFVYRTGREIGALAAGLRGIDGLVFTGGIGEHSAELRRRICDGASWLGVEISAGANDQDGPRISTERSAVSVWVVPTNEELTIARQTGFLLGLIDAKTAVRA